VFYESIDLHEQDLRLRYGMVRLQESSPILSVYGRFLPSEELSADFLNIRLMNTSYLMILLITIQLTKVHIDAIEKTK